MKVMISNARTTEWITVIEQYYVSVTIFYTALFDH